MLIGPPIPEMQLFKKLTLKIQGQGHGWGQSYKSQGESNILSTSLSFHVNLVYHCWAMTFSKFDLEIQGSRSWSTDKVTLQSHKVSLTSYRLTSLSFHVNRPSHSWYTAFSKFDLENPRSRSWVRSQFKSHNVGLTSYRLTYLLFHVNRASHSWVMTFSNFDLENQRSRSWVRSQFIVTMWV